MVGCPEQVAADTEEVEHESMHGEEALHVSGGFESSHLSLALPGRLMRHLRSIVLVLPCAVHHGRHHGPVRRGLAPQLVRDQPARQPALSLQHFAEEAYSSSAVAPRLDEEVE